METKGSPWPFGALYEARILLSCSYATRASALPAAINSFVNEGWATF